MRGGAWYFDVYADDPGRSGFEPFIADTRCEAGVRF
jgi:hypothetical protein